MRSISFWCGFWQANIHAQLMWKLWMYSLSRALISQVSHKLDGTTWEGTFLPPSPSPALHQGWSTQGGEQRVRLLSGQLQQRCWCGKYPHLCQRQLSAPAPERDPRQTHRWAVNTCPSAQQLWHTSERNGFLPAAGIQQAFYFTSRCIPL